MSAFQESLPGETARRWLARAFSPRAMESIFDPFLADLQADWLHAKSIRSAHYARWCLFFGYVSLVVQAATCAFGSLFGPNYTLAPVAGSEAASVESGSLCGRMARRVAALGVASLITFGLFVVMSTLISGQPDTADMKPAITVNFVRVRAPSAPIQPVRPELPEPPILKPVPPTTGNPTGEKLTEITHLPLDPVGDSKVLVDTDIIGSTEFARAASHSAFPRMRIAPMYPQRALERGVEGWVDVEFTVTEIGSVSDPVVINSQPNSIFNGAALRAVERWKYEPMVVDGEAVSRSGMRIRLVFEIDGE